MKGMMIWALALMMGGVCYAEDITITYNGAKAKVKQAVKDEPISICDEKGKRLDTIKIPFAMRRSASLVSSSAFKIGSTYTVKTKGYERPLQ